MSGYLQQAISEVDNILYKLRCYRDPQRIRNDVVDLIKTTPSLQPRSGSLARGPAQSHILFLAGTVPIFYNGVQYNIPINLWIIEAYPFSPPVSYVTPTPGMVIKQKHRHVDSAGMCYLPYLSNWNPNTCNLVGLIGTMSKVFGEDPPVRSQPTSTQPANPPSVQPPYNQPYSQPPSTGYGTSSPYPPTSSPYPPQSSPYPPQSSPYPPQSTYGNQPFEDPAIVAKRNAIANVTAKIQERLHQFNVINTKEVDDLISRGAELDAKGAVLTAEIASLEEDKLRMETDIESLTKSFEELTKWLQDNDSTVSGIDIDAVTEPRDSLSKQLLYLVAEEAAVEDSLYYLERKLNTGTLDTETFLKSVRALSTDQFLKRATIKKIHEKQRAGR